MSVPELKFGCSEGMRVKTEAQINNCSKSARYSARQTEFSHFREDKFDFTPEVIKGGLVGSELCSRNADRKRADIVQ